MLRERAAAGRLLLHMFDRRRPAWHMGTCQLVSQDAVVGSLSIGGNLIKPSEKASKLPTVLTAFKLAAAATCSPTHSKRK